MTTLAEIQEAIQRLAPEEQQALLHWLDEKLDDQLSMSDAFMGRSKRAELQLSEGEIARINGACC